MGQNKSSGGSVLRILAIGFSVIIALTWLVEIIRVPYLIFGESSEFNWLRVLSRTVVLLAVWTWLHYTFRRLLRRLHYLEEFLRICSWCRKVGSDDQWLTIEEYFNSKYATNTSHGICPECAIKLQQVIPPIENTG